MNRAKRVLDAGTGPGGSGYRDHFPNSEYVTLGLPGSGTTVEFDMESKDFFLWEPDPFDVIVMRHSLEHVSLMMVPVVLQKMFTILNPSSDTSEGAIHIMVPSLEWAAARLQDGQHSPLHPALLNHLYGSQQDKGQYHKSGFTLPLLRMAVKAAGFHVKDAGQQHYKIEMTIGDTAQVVNAMENVVTGLKVVKG